MTKPHAPSCDENRTPIFEVLQPRLEDKKKLLEIGSGTGQHAVYFAKELPHLIWQTADRFENHAGIIAWLNDAGLVNTRLPLKLDVSMDEWPNEKYDAIFSANTAHIMHWNDVENLFTGVGRVLDDEGVFLLYGPFNDHGKFTSESNARFDEWLKNRDAESGIRNKQDLERLAEKSNMILEECISMPANNFILCWKKMSA